jgi:hypothetical protein
MNWLNHHPDDLIERMEPPEALALLRQQETLTIAQMGTLDSYLHHWTLVHLQRTNDHEGVQDMLTLCEIAQDLALQGADGSAMAQRWNGFEDLLEGKRRYLQAARIAAPIRLKHQDEILRIIEGSDAGRVQQLELARSLKLSKGRVSQILGVLEARALVSRQRQGKENWVSAGHAGAVPASPQKANAATRVGEHLGAQVFAFPQAA